MCDRASRRAFIRGSLAGAISIGAMLPLDAIAKKPPLLRAPKNFRPGYLALERSGKLQLIERALWKNYDDKCYLCPRDCKERRGWGKVGVCKATSKLKVASSGPHFGEERPLVGSKGSGTIFFSNCNLLCCFCQNWELAHRGDGRHVSHEQLAKAMLALQRIGCHNINLVTPTHVVPNIVRALRIAIKKGLRLPLVYNTGGYDDLEVIKLLDGVVDIYMPDLKFMDAAIAARYLHKCKDYPKVAQAAIKEMHRQVGLLKVDGRGVAKRGLILRHLVMPHNQSGTDRFVKWVTQKLSPRTYVNIMGQYRPAHQARKHSKIARPLSNKEWIQAASWAMDGGLVHWTGR